MKTILYFFEIHINSEFYFYFLFFTFSVNCLKCSSFSKSFYFLTETLVLSTHFIIIFDARKVTLFWCVQEFWRFFFDIFKSDAFFFAIPKISSPKKVFLAIPQNHNPNIEFFSHWFSERCSLFCSRNGVFK